MEDKEDEVEDEDDDFELGQVMNEIAAQNFSDKETVADDLTMTAAVVEGVEGGDDDEVAQLKEYLTEMQVEFRQQKADHEAELVKIGEERTSYSEFISKIKLQGIQDEQQTYQ